MAMRHVQTVIKRLKVKRNRLYTGYYHLINMEQLADQFISEK